jgi:hypothetical protein
LINQALKLAGQGFRVFPVRPNEKLPAIKEWPTMATTDPKQIKKWWLYWRLTNANIGIVPAPDFFVFDMDPRHEGWRRSLAKLRALGLPLDTMTVKTPGGGFHLYYRHPGGGVLKASDAGWSREFPGIDVRADNAYVLGPGSVVNGKTYTLMERSV